MKISEAYETVTGQVLNVTWRNITIINPRNAAMYINVFQVWGAPFPSHALGCMFIQDLSVVMLLCE
jgi:hypothetical protein